MSNSTSSINSVSLPSSFASANRGALTTIFTPPASCLSTTTLVSYLTSISGTSSSFTTTKIFINHYSWGDGSCYPSTIATISGTTRWGNGYYYSPGICPSGWTSACQISTSAFGFPTAISSSTSAVMCCPSDWSCGQLASRCYTTLSADQTLTSVWLPPNPTPSQTLDLMSGKRNITEWVNPTDTSAVCDGIPVMWENTDVQILSLLGLTTTGSSTSAMQTSSNTSSTSTTTILLATATGTIPTPSTMPIRIQAVSTGARVAIGVLIPIILIALILGMFFFFRRRKRANMQKLEEEQHELDTNIVFKGELDAKERTMELDSKQTFEADYGHAIVEIGDGKEKEQAFELDADQHQPRGVTK